MIAFKDQMHVYVRDQTRKLRRFWQGIDSESATPHLHTLSFCSHPPPDALHPTVCTNVRQCTSLYSTAPPLPHTLITPSAVSLLCLSAPAASDMFSIFVWMLISPHLFFPLSPVAAPAQESSTWFMGCASASVGLSPHRRARDLDPVTCCVHCLDDG